MQAAVFALTMPCKNPLSLEPPDCPEAEQPFEVTSSNQNSEAVNSQGEDPCSPSGKRLVRAADFAKTVFLFRPLEPSLEEVVVHQDNENRYQMPSGADDSLAAAQQVGTCNMNI